MKQRADSRADSPGPGICLVMIVRDEAHVVAEGLESVLPYISDFVVVDTGSTDGTQQVIQDLLRANQIPGHVLERPWRDFGTNRSEALALARELSRSDYLWMFDADDLVSGHPNLEGLTADGYHLRFGPGQEYWRVQIFRRALPWRYEGVLHEYPTCDGMESALGHVEGDYCIVSRRLGSRNRDERKYERDAATLEAALAAEPGNTRYAFYLAQSWFDAGQPERALAAYRRRVEMGGWQEEVFYSRYRAALCLQALGRPVGEVQEALEQCHRAHSHRAEPLVRAAEIARNAGRYAEAYDLAGRAARIARPGPEALFVEVGDYGYRARDELAIAAYYVGHQAESFDLCEELLALPDLPDSERARIERNRDFAVPHVQAALLAYDAALIERIAARAPRDEPRVTLSITSCRRLGLFVDTLCSFLKACVDIHLIDRFICIDDGSSKADRAEMQRLFPFFEFVFKDPADKGHVRSLNVILERIDTPYLLHLEDDWRFFAQRRYVAPAIELLEEDPRLGQVLFNRNYAETLEDRELPGGFRRRSKRSGIRYVAHEHYAPGSPELQQFHQAHGNRPANAYWPHFSLRPSLLRTATLLSVGVFDEGASHFELDYARRYFDAGFRSVFFDTICAVHSGRLTSERGDPGRPNAYDLNRAAQFGAPAEPPARPPVKPAARCRVRLMGSWASSEELLAAFARQARQDRRWDELELTADDDADYFALFNYPRTATDHFRADRTIVFAMEPPHAVARWGEWARPDPRRFLQVRHHDRFPNAGEWHLGKTWAELKNDAIGPKRRLLSAVVSSKTGDPGQRLRVEFLKSLEARGVPIDIFGYDNAQRFASYRGALPARDKCAGLLPYRYTIAVENSAHPNYFTEKVLDAILAECLPFYWGCPNLEEYIDARAFVRLPLEDPEASCSLVAQTIADETWSRRIDVIRSEKQRILDELQLLPTLARVLRGHRLAERLGVRVINLDRRPDRLQAFNSQLEERAGPGWLARVERFAAVDGRQLSMTPEIRRTFRGNDFGFRRAVVACALSHMALWKELAHSEAPGFLIFEDDVSLCQGFSGQLVELCGELQDRRPDFDIVLLGHSTWELAPRLDFARSLSHARLKPFVAERYLGGLFAYIVSRKGAEKLLSIAGRDGVQNGIDRFIQYQETELEILVSEPFIATSQLVASGSGLDSDIQNDFEALGD